ncbi:Prominin-1-A [Trichoplax sp. H2]|nr:Prominin-1-A [Trichoplax sp. H2]|eukprot:RDD38795.1 Prominin-1-A [Trichoplax sp. H2]
MSKFQVGILTFLVLAIHTVYGQNTTTVNNGVITFSQLPTIGTTQSNPNDYVPESNLATLYAMAKGFTNALIPGHLPYTFMVGILSNLQTPNGILTYLTTNYHSLTSKEVGLLACVAIGLLIGVLMPIVGLIFCCCRMCGKCGGAMVQTHKKRSHCYCYTIFLAIFASIALAGGILNILTDKHIMATVPYVNGVAQEAISDLNRWKNTATAQIETLAGPQLNYTADLVKADLGDAAVRSELGAPLQVAVEPHADSSIVTVTNISKTVNDTADELNAINARRTQLVALQTSLTNEVNKAKTDLNSAISDCNTLPGSPCSDIDTSVINVNVDYGTLPSIDSQIAEVQKVRNLGLTNMASQAQSEIRNLPDTVVTQTSATRSSVVTSVNTLQSQAGSQVATITQPIKNIDFSTFYTPIANALNGITNSDAYKYAEYGLNGFAGLLILQAGLIMLALLLGGLSYKDDVPSIKRSTTSNIAGYLLMAAAGLIIIFSFLYCFVAITLLTIGANTEKACQGLRDNSFFSQVADARLPGGKTVLESLINPSNANNPTTQLFSGISAAGLISACQQNRALYTALNLSKSANIANIVEGGLVNTTLNSAETQLNSITIDYSKLNVADNSTLNNLDTLKSQIDAISISNYDSLINKAKVTFNISDYADTLTAKAEQIRQVPHPTAASVATKLDSVAIQLNTTIPNTIIEPINSNLTAMNTSLQLLVTNKAKLSTQITSVKDAVINWNSYVANTLPNTVAGVINTFKNKLFGYVRQYSSHLSSEMKNSVGRCQPVYNAYASLALKAACGYGIDGLSGFWFALCMCVGCFIPNCILSIKLAKYFRRMKTEFFTSKNAKQMFENSPNKDNVQLKNYKGNKVGPSGPVAEKVPPPPGYKANGHRGPPRPPMKRSSGHKVPIAY